MDTQASPTPPKRRWRFATIAGLALATIGGGVVVAQYGGYGYHPRWHGGGYEGRWRGGQDGPGGRDMGLDRQARLQRFCSFDTSRWHGVARTFVKADLRLTNEQAAEFDRLADGMMPQLEELKRDACASVPAMTGPAPDRLRKFADMARKVADITEKNAEPFAKFYAVLDAGQKARIDMMMSRGRHFGGPGGMGPGGRMGPGGHMEPGGPAGPDDQPGYGGDYRGPRGYGGDYRAPRGYGEFRGPPGYGRDFRGPPQGYGDPRQRGYDDAPQYPGQRWQ